MAVRGFGADQSRVIFFSLFEEYKADAAAGENDAAVRAFSGLQARLAWSVSRDGPARRLMGRV